MKESIRDAMIDTIDCITVTTSASTLVCTDEEGKPLLPAIMVSDKRAIEEANEIRALKEGKETEKNTGLKVSASLLLPKILWIKKNRKEYSHIRFFLTSNDYLIYKLYGNMVTDYLECHEIPLQGGE